MRFDEAAVIIESKDKHKESVNIEESKVVSKTIPNTKKHVELVDEGFKTSPKNSASQHIVLLKENEEKECCWGCYKLFVRGSGYVDPFSNKVINNS